MEPFICIFRRENEMFVRIFFKFRIYDEGIQGKFEARNENIYLYTLLRISPRKINILKKNKLGPRELKEVDDINVKKMLLNLTNVLKSTIKMSKKKKKNKSAQNFLILKYVIECVKTSKFYY